MSDWAKNYYKGYGEDYLCGIIEGEMVKDGVSINDTLYPVIREIVMELDKKGYKFMEYDIWRDKSWGHRVKFNVIEEGVTQLGVIQFVYKINDMGISLYHMEYIRNYSDKVKKKENLHHIIQYFPFISIESDTIYSAEPPEWLMICANVIKRNLSSITLPEWVNECPDAKRYVNVIFQKKEHPAFESKREAEREAIAEAAEKARLNKIIDDLTYEIKIKPNSAQAYYNRGMAYKEQKYPDDFIIKDFEKAVELDPTNNNYREMLDKELKRIEERIAEEKRIAGEKRIAEEKRIEKGLIIYRGYIGAIIGGIVSLISGIISIFINHRGSISNTFGNVIAGAILGFLVTVIVGLIIYKIKAILVTIIKPQKKDQ